MPHIKVTVNHKLGSKEAVRRINQLTENKTYPIGKEISDLTNIWTNYNSKFSFLIKGIQVSGKLDVNDFMLTINGKIPYAFFHFKRQIEITIHQHATILLS